VKVSRQRVVAVVTGHANATKKGPELELSVLAPGGKAKLSTKVPLNDSNKLGVSELVSASANALSAIDSDAPAKDSAAKPSAKALAQRARSKSPRRLAARPHAGHARG
jgi:hypothetical protein